MATANYTEAQTEKMVAKYNANPNRETVEALAKELGKNTRSVIAKLSREGVFRRNRCLRTLPSLAVPPTIVPILASPAPYRKA